MTRVKRGTTSLKRRKNVLKQTKGFRFGRSTKEIQATEALLHAGTYAFAHRRDKKADKRTLWNIKINASLREKGLTYSKFIGMLTKKDIKVDRKILATLAEFHPESFNRFVSKVS